MATCLLDPTRLHPRTRFQRIVDDLKKVSVRGSLRNSSVIQLYAALKTLTLSEIFTMGASGCLMRQCMLCVKLFKWLPVVLITAIVSWSYYAYVIQLCICKCYYVGQFSNPPLTHSMLHGTHLDRRRAPSRKAPTQLIPPLSVRIDNVAEQVLYLIFFHISFSMFVWSYWQTIFTAPGEIPRFAGSVWPSPDSLFSPVHAHGG